MIDTKFLQTEAYIDAQCKGSYKKNHRKAITGVKLKKNQKQKQTGHSVKSRNGQQEGTVLAGTNFVGAPISSVFCYSFFLVFDLQC